MQLKAYYRRFRRWQQEGPHYVNRHQDTVLHCHNCGTEFADNYCPRCGQRAEVGRVRWKSIGESLAVVFGLDSRSFPYTLVQLLLRPGYLVRDFISGRRQVSYPPVNMLVIVSLLAVIVESVFHVQNDVLSMRFNIPEVDRIIQWFNDNKSWGTLLTQSFFILPTWIVFHFAPRYPRHTLPEGFFLQVFLSTQNLLIGFVNYIYGDLKTLLGMFFLIITYRQLFGYGWWGTFWRCMVTYVTSFLMMLPFFIVAFLYGDDDFKNTVKDYGLWIFAIIGVLVVVMLVVMLGVSYLISRHQYKKKANFHVKS